MTTWDLFRDLQMMRQELENMAMQDGGANPSRWRLAFLPGRAARQYPLVNLLDDGDNIFLEALMPGVEPGDVDVTVQGNTLTMSGKKDALVGRLQQRYGMQKDEAEREVDRWLGTM